MAIIHVNVILTYAVWGQDGSARLGSLSSLRYTINATHQRSIRLSFSQGRRQHPQALLALAPLPPTLRPDRHPVGHAQQGSQDRSAGGVVAAQAGVGHQAFFGPEVILQGEIEHQGIDSGRKQPAAVLASATTISGRPRQSSKCASGNPNSGARPVHSRPGGNLLRPAGQTADPSPARRPRS